jgi:mannose-6-phosphate isomerase-like protein (cupin superfamily)
VWTIIYGGGVVEVDGEKWEVAKGDVVQIPVGEKHRIENTTNEPLVFIEVQWGKSFEESDITRYEDKYDRV